MTTDILGPVRHIIGTPYVDSIKPYILELTGLAIVAGPRDITTRDFRSDRVIIAVDEQGHISAMSVS